MSARQISIDDCKSIMCLPSRVFLRPPTKILFIFAWISDSRRTRCGDDWCCTAWFLNYWSWIFCFRGGEFSSWLEFHYDLFEGMNTLLVLLMSIYLRHACNSYIVGIHVVVSCIKDFSTDKYLYSIYIGKDNAWCWVMVVDDLVTTYIPFWM